jgi:hypothetical protein
MKCAIATASCPETIRNDTHPIPAYRIFEHVGYRKDNANMVKVCTMHGVLMDWDSLEIVAPTNVRFRRWGKKKYLDALRELGL